MVTLKDIARMAGVSVSTASRIISGSNTKVASKQTADNIWRIVRETGYVPNNNARNLKSGSNEYNFYQPMKAIGCIFTSSSDTCNDPFFSHIARGVEQEAVKQGYVIGYSYSTCDINNAVLYQNIIANKVDGIVVLGRFGVDFLSFLKNNYKNIIYAGINSVNKGFDEVICDGYKAACAAVEYLVKLGHVNIGFIGQIPDKSIVNEHRYRGFCDTIQLKGLKKEQCFIQNVELSSEGGYEAIKRLIKNGNMPTAVFCANDFSAIGAMKAARESGLRVPYDISIIGIDDIEMAQYVYPMLTTIHIPKEDLGKMAVKMLIDRIEKGHRLPVRLEVPFELRIRGSCRNLKDERE